MDNSYKLLQASEIPLDFHNLLMKDVHTSQQGFPSLGHWLQVNKDQLSQYSTYPGFFCVFKPGTQCPKHHISDKSGGRGGVVVVLIFLCIQLTGHKAHPGCASQFLSRSQSALPHKQNKPKHWNIPQSLSFSQIPRLLTFIHNFSPSFSSLCSLDSNPLPENMNKWVTVISE